MTRRVAGCVERWWAVVRPARRRSRIAGRIRRITWRGWFSIVALSWSRRCSSARGSSTSSTLHDRVPRNVTVAGVDIGRRGQAGTDAAIDRAAEAYSRTRIEFVIGGQGHLAAGGRRRPAPRPGRHPRRRQGGRSPRQPGGPTGAVGRRVLPPRRAPVRTSVDTTRLAAALAALPGQVPVHEPTVVGSPYGVGITEGRTGRGFAAAEVAGQLEQAATLGKLPIRVGLTARFIEPTHTDAEAQLLSLEAARLTERPINLVTLDTTVPAGPALAAHVDHVGARTEGPRAGHARTGGPGRRRAAPRTRPARSGRRGLDGRQRPGAAHPPAQRDALLRTSAPARPC